MKKNNRVILGVIALCFILLGGFCVQKIKAGSEFMDRADVLKEKINQNNSDDDSPIIIQGKDVIITESEIEKETKVNELQGAENAEEAAVKHLIKRKVLLNKALEMGYTVTEEEIDEQISQVKEAVKDTENYSDYVNFVNEYGGEDVYWADIRETTRDTMIINKYLDNEKQEYDEVQDGKVQDNTNLLDGWNKRKAEIINELVENQDINISDGKYKNLSLTW